MKPRLRLGFGLFLIVGLVPSAGFEPATETVHVPVFVTDRPSRIELRAEQGAVDLYAGSGSERAIRLATGESVQIAVRDGELYAALPSGGRYSLSYRARPADDGLIRLSITSPGTTTSSGVFDGQVTLRVDEQNGGVMSLGTDVDLERLVAAVVDRAYVMEESEAAKALAVAVRTQLMRFTADGGDSVPPDALLHFAGVSGVRPLAERAATETGGEVLMDGDRLIFAPMFESSGGHTADNERVWESEPLPYLRGKPDPFDAAPVRSWSATVERSRLLAFLTEHVPGHVDDLLINARNSDGRVRTIALVLEDGGRHHLSGEDFRQLVNRCACPGSIKSTNFTLVRGPDGFLFEGIGRGHGVGLPIWGAHGMAVRGQTYTRILSYYFEGAEIVNREDASVTLDVHAMRGRVAPAHTAEPSTSQRRDVPQTADLPATTASSDSAFKPNATPLSDVGHEETHPATEPRIGW